MADSDPIHINMNESEIFQNKKLDSAKISSEQAACRCPAAPSSGEGSAYPPSGGLSQHHLEVSKSDQFFLSHRRGCY
jgi:hypothetical protein